MWDVGDMGDIGDMENMGAMGISGIWKLDDADCPVTVLAVVNQMCTQGRSMPCTPDLKQLALSHYSCNAMVAAAQLVEHVLLYRNWLNL